MANQNPQPEIYTTTHEFATGSTPGTSVTETVFTNQSSAEEVRIYSISVNIYDNTDGAAQSGASINRNDYTAQIKIGNNFVPSFAFDLGVITTMNQVMITFPTPILVLFQQPISVIVTYMGGNSSRQGGANTGVATAVRVSLHAELALTQVACQEGSMDWPSGQRNSRQDMIDAISNKIMGGA